MRLSTDERLARSAARCMVYESKPSGLAYELSLGAGFREPSSQDCLRGTSAGALENKRKCILRNAHIVKGYSTRTNRGPPRECICLITYREISRYNKVYILIYIYIYIYILIHIHTYIHTYILSGGALKAPATSSGPLRLALLGAAALLARSAVRFSVLILARTKD